MDEKAVHRFGSFGSHINCRVVVTSKRLIFMDRDNDQDSFEMTIAELRQARFSKSKQLPDDLVIHGSDGLKREIGLKTGQWQRVMEKINEITRTT